MIRSDVCLSLHPGGAILLEVCLARYEIHWYPNKILVKKIEIEPENTIEL
jgi:hypothetical protein